MKSNFIRRQLGIVILSLTILSGNISGPFVYCVHAAEQNKSQSEAVVFTGKSGAITNTLETAPQEVLTGSAETQSEEKSDNSDVSAETISVPDPEGGDMDDSSAENETDSHVTDTDTSDETKPETSDDESHTDSSDTTKDDSNAGSDDSAKPEDESTASDDSTGQKTSADESDESKADESKEIKPTPSATPAPTATPTVTQAPTATPVPTKIPENSVSNNLSSSGASSYTAPAYQASGRTIAVVSTKTRKEIVEFALQYITEKSGLPYVWGGESLETGVDCSGFMQQVYHHFGMEIPRTSSEQAAASKRINIADAKPGDLVFKAREGTVYHVMMVVENRPDKKEMTVVEARGAAWGLLVADFAYEDIYCAGRFMDDKEFTSTQAKDLIRIGELASKGDSDAKESIIEKIADSVQMEWSTAGMTPSVLIAKVICDTNWMSFDNTPNVSVEDNNILSTGKTDSKENAEHATSVKTDSLSDSLNDVSRQFGETSLSTGLMDMLNHYSVSFSESEEVTDDISEMLNQHSATGIASTEDTDEPLTDTQKSEQKSSYDDIESCMEDYANTFIKENDDLKGSTHYGDVLDAMKMTEDERNDILSLIREYSLDSFDTMERISQGMTDSSNYVQDEKELIWAIVAQEDDTSYEGALAVITSAMNRADVNYGGYGTTALAQLTAPGQYCYSPSISDPSYYQRRLNGNVPEFVKEAVTNCLEKGTRNHPYKSFRSTYAEGRVQFGSNWFFN